MAEEQSQAHPFDAHFQAFLVDLNGDGIPDATVRAPGITNRDRRRISREAMSGRDPSALDQARLQSDAGRIEANMAGMPERLATVAKEGALAGAQYAFPGTAAFMAGLAPSPAYGGAPTSELATPDQLEAEARVHAARRLSDPTVWQSMSDFFLPSAEAQTLTRKQQRELEMEDVRRKQAADDDRQRALNQVQVDAARQEAERKAREMQARAEAEAAKRPWRERNPEAAAALPTIGYALAAGVPAAGAAIRNLGSWLPGSRASAINRAATEGERLLAKTGQISASDGRTALLRRDQLTNYMDTAPSPVSDFATNRLMPALAGGVLAYEGRVYPDQVDARDPNLTQEQRDQAWLNMLSGGGFAQNLLMGGLTGLSAQETVDRLIPKKEADMARAEAVRDRLSRIRRR